MTDKWEVKCFLGCGKVFDISKTGHYEFAPDVACEDCLAKPNCPIVMVKSPSQTVSKE